METLEHLLCTVGWVARLRCSWLSPGEKQPEFPMGESPMGQYSWVFVLFCFLNREVILSERPLRRARLGRALKL